MWVRETTKTTTRSLPHLPPPSWENWTENSPGGKQLLGFDTPKQQPANEMQCVWELGNEWIILNT